MTLDIANRLVELRKKHGYSQEKLAEMLGLSRQAVSKWERAEASPDTDNLIMLSRLYEVSLDQLLNTDEADEEFVKDAEEKEETQEKQRTEDYVNIGRHGIHVEAKNGDRVHIGWDGIHVNDASGEKVHIDKDGIFVDDGLNQYVNTRGKVVINGVEYSKKDVKRRLAWVDSVAAVFATMVFLAVGSITDIWHPTWIIFFLVPIIDTLVRAIIYRSAHIFAYPVLVTAGYLCLGFLANLWHPGWALFITIPLYYTLIPPKYRDKDNNEDDEDDSDDD